MQMESVCRTCRGSRQPLRPIWGCHKRVRGRIVLCADMLAACAPNTVIIHLNCTNIIYTAFQFCQYESPLKYWPLINENHDGFPAHICLLCYRKLCSAYRFRLQCESSYTYFSNYPVKSVKVEDIKIEKQDDEFSSTNFISLSVDRDNTKSQDEDITLIDSSHLDIASEIINKLKSENDVFNDDDRDSINSFDKSCSDGDIEDVNRKKLQRKKSRKDHKSLAKMKRKHLKKNSMGVYVDSLTCTLCPKTFKFKNLLVAHQDSHLGIKRYFCEICKKSYRNEKDHKNMHRRGFKFECELCRKRFNTKAKLAIHKEIHSEARAKFPCDVEGCGKYFLSPNGLERHRLSHSGSKNFICQMCSKSFIDKYQLELHIRTHTNDRRHTCTHCDKKFITKSAKNSHERWHLKTKNYLCKHCEKAFVTSSGLKRHLLCHTKELSEVCRICGKKFARFDNRKRHEMAMHHVSENSSKEMDMK